MPEPPRASPPDPQPVFGFTSLVVSKLLFQELPKAEVSGSETTGPKKLDANVAIGYGTDGKDRGEVRLHMTVLPDPSDKPYRIEVEVTGQFIVREGSLEDLDQFCREVAPTVLFPYVREAVHRVTLDARYGSLRLDPLNIRGILAANEWHSPKAGAAPKPPLTPNAPAARKTRA